jgi:hypothetical protein
MLDFRDVLINAFPRGELWRPDPDGDFYALLGGIGDVLQDMFDDVDSLAYVRDPRRTELLRDLEYEYGQLYNASLTESQRRVLLASIKYAKRTTNSWEALQNALVNAGFTDAVVIPNSPTIDPDIILADNGELVVNGPVYSSQRPNYVMAAGSDIAFAGHYRAFAGYFRTMKRIAKTYDVGADSDLWRFVFFIGSAKAGSWPSSPSVTALDVPAEQEYFLKQTILTKPLHTWCVLCANYT